MKLSLASTHPMNLSDFFSDIEILMPGSFDQLDETQTTAPASLVYCQNLDFLRQALQNRNVSAVITTPQLAAEIPQDQPIGVVCSKDPRLSFFTLYNKLYHKQSIRPLEPSRGHSCSIHGSAIVSASTRIGNRVEIGPGVVISENVEIGDDVFIDANVVIGAEGLLTLRDHNGRLLRVKHAGGVRIGTGCMILAGATIAKSLYASPTSIDAECQVGIMSNIGHGASIGDDTVVSGNCVVAGRTKIGRSVWIGSSCSIAQGLRIGDGAQIKMGSVVVSNIAEQSIVSGNFAIAHARHVRQFLGLNSR
ncbi:MAG: DapH/DapD/GlmU-related protein [Pusillimonas sp.]